MKLLNFITDGVVKLGVLTEKGILDVSKTGLSLNMEALIASGDEGLSQLQRAIDKVTDASWFYPQEKITFGPAVTQPEKILCIGLNYISHTDECQMELPVFPVVFSKFNNALAAHKENISLPDNAIKIDYEGELVIVIGKTAKNIEKDQALDYVFGYTVGNDFSARDLQFRTAQWLIGKTCDQFAPLGPVIVTRDQLSPNQLEIRCTVNGEIRQRGNTKDMIFSCAEIVSYLSQQMTLKPGDVIFTGTPSGVVLGYPENEQIWLKSGDRVLVEIEGIGQLENKLI